ncbi:MAG: ABC transporter ATP-binding protein [Lachnospiraceae bacterium]|jgi:peptide/nickel transport system ATP-binding protein|nr:ABC transporter ATP-binding protein [Lachnospiraceae bacterium]
MEERLLTIKDLYVEYITDDARVFAVNGIDLAINKGETLGLVGETGAGKTTTALSIMRLLPEKVGLIKSGSIVLNGKDVTKASEADMRLLRGETVSMIFQDPMTSLNPVLTVGDQIAEVLELHKKHKNKADVEARVDEILKMVGLPPERKHDFPHQFSGGMKQRIVIAIALACEPLLLLADEPTTALDVTIQAQVLALMNELKQNLNTAMILITHDLGVVAQTCDRVAIMYAGEVIETGTVEQIFSGDEHHPYTVGLFESIPDLKKKTRRLHPIDGLMPDPTDLPTGCKFHTRCPHCMEICKTELPKPIEKDGHLIRCHLLEGGGRKAEGSETL